MKKIITRLLLLQLLTCVLLTTNAQPLNKKVFSDIAESNSTQEFLTIKSGVSISKADFIANYLSILNLAPNSEMKEVRQETNDVGITMTRYQQYVNKIKAQGAEMVIHEKEGRIKYISGRYMTTPPLNTIINVAEQEGLQKALKQINSTDYLWLNEEAEAQYKQIKKDPNATYQPKGELILAPLPGAHLEMTFRLCWLYSIHVNPQTESYKVYIDATSGEVFNRIPLTFNCSGGTSTTLWNGARTIYTQLTAGSYRSVSNCNSAQILTYNGNGNDNGVGATFYTDADNAWPNTALGNYIAQAHFGSKQTRDYYSGIHTREGYDGAGADFITYLNPGYTGNAYWTGSATSFGGSSTGASPYVTLDVCGHEHTHGVIDFTSNLTYSYESGALNESFADCIGEAVEEYTLGSADWIHRNEIGGGNRSFINPNAKGDPDTYLGTNWYTGASDNGGVHTNSGVQNYWFYLLSVGGSGTNDNGNAFSVTGIGIDKARLIAYDCMIALSSSDQYTNARAMSIQKAKDRYGDCSNEVVQTTNAWRAVGVGAAYVVPAPLPVSISASLTDVCPGGTVTLTASGATTYSWSSPISSTGTTKVVNPNVTTTYTVIGTNAEQCTGTAVKTITVNPIPTVTPTISDDELCPGQSTTLSAGTNSTINSLLTTLAGGNGLAGNAFDIHAYNSITIKDFKMHMQLGVDSVEVYYKSGGYGNANITSNAGWTKLGATVAVTSAGPGNLTTIPTTSDLSISAGSTYGIIILCKGNNFYTNGTTVGSIAASNPDLYITEGHGGNGFGGTFNFTLSPRVFNGTVEYSVNYVSYLWSPSGSLSSATTSPTTATPSGTTTYTLNATDGNGCVGTGTVTLYVYPNPTITGTSATPASICAGGSSQLNLTTSAPNSSQSLFTTLVGNNGFAGNIFDVHALHSITITDVRMNITSGDSAEVWYKTSPYGNANVISSAGWIKLGNTVPISPAGAGALTLIPTSTNLAIPAGATFGMAVISKGSNNYSNGTAVGTVAYSNPDLEITEGHGGTGFGGSFNFINSPRVFNGQIDYTVTNSIASYAWNPSSGLSSTFIQNPVAGPYSTTNYRAIVTDIHGCKDTAYQILYVNPPASLTTTVSPTSICPGDSAQLNVTASVNEADSLFTTVAGGNSNGGNAFNIITSKPVIIRGFKMNISVGVATQAEVWYKPGGYGNTNFTGTAGWTKLGATVTITPAGIGNLTTIPITTTLSIASGQTYGFMVVCNGTANYTNGLTAVGTVFVSNPDIAITVGHGGTGIGAYSFAASPRVWNGEVVYDAVNSITSLVWSPNTNMINSFVSPTKAAPLSNTIYNVTTTDINGCTSVASAAVNVSPLPLLGSATATPASFCVGSNVNLTYVPPAGNQCFGGIQSGFAGTYAPSLWTTTLTNSNGTVTATPPNQISMTSSNGLSGAGTTGYTITIPCSGVVTFNWSYSTVDGPQYDYPKYSINGGTGIVFPGFIAQNGASKTQSGTFNLMVTAGQTFSFQAYSADNIGGACTIVITGFKAPYQSVSGQSVVWYNAPGGGSNLGNGNPQSHTPATANTFTYYAQITSSITGCTNTSRVATNAVVVNPIPALSSTPSQTRCSGVSGTYTATSATPGTTFSWTRAVVAGISNAAGSGSGSVITETLVNTTASPVNITYVITLLANGCSNMQNVTVTVNPQPTITGSASPGIVCPGGAVTLTGSGAGITYHWEPGNLNGSPVIVNPVVQTTYTVTATGVNGCTKSQNFTILMNPVPNVTTSVIPTATLCTGGSTTILASGALTYSWQPGGATTASINVTPPGTTTYTVIGTNSQGCKDTATQQITVSAIPTLNSSLTQTRCSGIPTTYTATSSIPGITFSWTRAAVAGISNAAGSGSGAAITETLINTTAAPVNVTYTITLTNNGCSHIQNVIITVNACGLLNLRALIEGYYIGSGKMEDVLNNSGLSTDTLKSDSVIVEFHDQFNPVLIITTTTGVLNINGWGYFSFPPALYGGTYFLSIRGRTFVETWSKLPITVGPVTTFDFTAP